MILLFREGEIVMMYANDKQLVQNMQELFTMVQASIECDKTEAWDKLMGSGANWKPGGCLRSILSFSNTTVIFLSYIQ